MIILQNINKNYGVRNLFNNISYYFPNKSRVALVGNNGAGKTTLLDILCGFDDDFDGEVIIPRGVRLGYLPQSFNPSPEATILEETLTGAVELNSISAEREMILEKMATDYSEEIFARYEYLEQTFNTLNGYRIKEDACEILRGLGFKDEQLTLSVEQLSGGWKMRIEFAKMLLNRPNFLILDEPTNHLDLPTIEWFEIYLKKFDGTILFVSHDKDLLNRLSTHILHLRQGQLTPYVGNFEAFLDAFALAQEQNTHASRHLKLQTDHIEKFVNTFRATASKAKAVQSRVKMLAKLQILQDNIEFEEMGGTMQLKLNNTKQSGKIVATAKNLSIGYDKPLIRPLSFDVLRGQHIAILGGNGLGKTTLLKTILGRQPALDGEINLGHNVLPGYFAQEHLDALREDLTVLDNVKEADSQIKEFEARALLGSLGLKGDDVFKRVNVLSGGEKSRLALACILAQKPNVLFLDEPTNHLDLYACENLANALANYEGTVIFVSHNRAFINDVATHILYLKEREIIQLTPVPDKD